MGLEHGKLTNSQPADPQHPLPSAHMPTDRYRLRALPLALVLLAPLALGGCKDTDKTKPDATSQPDAEGEPDAKAAMRCDAQRIAETVEQWTKLLNPYQLDDALWQELGDSCELPEGLAYLAERNAKANTVWPGDEVVKKAYAVTERACKDPSVFDAEVSEAEVWKRCDYARYEVATFEELGGDLSGVDEALGVVHALREDAGIDPALATRFGRVLLIGLRHGVVGFELDMARSKRLSTLRHVQPWLALNSSVRLGLTDRFLLDMNADPDTDSSNWTKAELEAFSATLGEQISNEEPPPEGLDTTNSILLFAEGTTSLAKVHELETLLSAAGYHGARIVTWSEGPELGFASIPLASSVVPPTGPSRSRPPEPSRIWSNSSTPPRPRAAPRTRRAARPAPSA